MFAKIPLESISFWQIWVERRQERARYTVLGEGSFWLPYYIILEPKRKCNVPLSSLL